MKKPATAWTLAALTLVLAAAASAQPTEQPAPPGMEEYMEKYATPGEHHKHLEALAGSWTTKTKFWPTPDAPVMEWNGTAQQQMALGGRYLLTRYESEFMGQPFVGMGTAAFDRYRQKYIEAWIDTLGTMMVISEGTCDGTGKVRNVKAEFDDPLTQKRTYLRSVYRIADADHYTIEMFSPGPDGKEIKVMEISLERR